MSARYSTALSHIVLAGTSIYCYLVARNQAPFVFAKCTFGTIILHSVIGIWRWGNPTYGPNADKLYNFTALLQDYLVLPCVVSSVWLQYGYIHELAYAFAVISFIPIITNANDNYNEDGVNKELLHTMIIVNCLALGALSFLHQNYFGLAACVSYAFNHFVIRNDRETYFQVTSQDLYNYAMCFFAFFSLKTMLD